MAYHIQVGDRTFCDVTGCIAGLRTADKAGVHTCSFPSRAKARDAVKALTPFYCVPVRAIQGDCPNA